MSDSKALKLRVLRHAKSRSGPLGLALANSLPARGERGRQVHKKQTSGSPAEGLFGAKNAAWSSEPGHSHQCAHILLDGWQEFGSPGQGAESNTFLKTQGVFWFVCLVLLSGDRDQQKQTGVMAKSL